MACDGAYVEKSRPTGAWKRRIAAGVADVVAVVVGGTAVVAGTVAVVGRPTGK